MEAAIALHKSAEHTLKKFSCDRFQLLKGLGVEGDAHMGEKVKHRSRVAADPNQPNLRQVHLIHAELHEELARQGFNIEYGAMGENITTRGIDLLELPTNTVLKIGSTAQIKITGLRNPCVQLDGIQPGLMKAVLDRDEEGNLIRKAGVMAIVIASGQVSKGDPIAVIYPPKPFLKLQKV